MADGTQKFGILTSGGDAPGMNAAIRAATLIGRSLGYQVIGIERGYRGLVDGSFAELQPTDVQGILRDGGTILGSARCLEFHEASVREAARRRLAEQGIASVLVIGGNGSLAGARALSDLAYPDAPAVIGLPASIDNDLAYTGLSIGVDTAMNTIVEAIDKIVDTAGAHDRTFIVEVMGRDCGYLAMTSALATGADLALFPESGRSEQDIVDSVVNAVLAVRARRRRHRVIIVKAEGVKVPAERLRALLDARLQEQGIVPETRVTVLGHVVRGGRPSAFDRLMASRLATSAVHALAQGQNCKMVGWLSPLALPPEIGTQSSFDPYTWLVDLQAVLQETDRLIRGESALARWRTTAFSNIEGALLL
jgi:6-phosphofructokinase 1